MSGAVADALFPGLAGALDPEQVRAQLERALPECRNGLQVEDVRIFNVQYRPKTSCSILYQVKFRHGEKGRSATQQLAGHLVPPDRQPHVGAPAAVAAYRELGALPLREPVVHIPELSMEAWAYPYDPRLPGLLHACDPRRVRDSLARMWKRRPVRVRRVAIDSLGYTPAARAALHYEVLSEERDTGLPEVRHLVAKTDAQTEASELFARNWAVWRGASGRIRLAAPVGYLPECGAWLQERVDGERLADAVATGNVYPLLRQTAGFLAVLHELELPLRSRRAAAHHVKSVRRWAGMLAAIRPGGARRIRDLRDRIVSRLERQARITGPIHGDLHPANVLVAGERVTLVDLDNMSLGDRLLDVGRFLSALRVSSLRAFGDADALAEARESFLDRYLGQTGEDPRRARLFEAASLVISAGTGFRLQREGWDETAALLIDEAARTLGLAESGKFVAPATRPADQPRAAVTDPRTDWPTDPLYMAALLAPHVRDTYGAEVVRCECELKARGARRDRLRYTVHASRDGDRLRIALDGIRWHDGRGGRVSRRLAAVGAVLTTEPGAPILPRQVAYLRDLGLQVLELPEGVPFEACLVGGDGHGAAGALAEALGALQRTSGALERKRALEEQLDSLRRRVGLLDGTALGARALKLLEQVTPRLAEASVEPVTALRHVSPRRLVLVADGRIGLREIDDLVLAHPLLDPADFLGRLTLARLNGAPIAESVDATFRDRYATLGPIGTEGLSGFEAATLLRHACIEGQRDPESTLALQLLRAAERRLGEAPTEGRG